MSDCLSEEEGSLPFIPVVNNTKTNLTIMNSNSSVPPGYIHYFDKVKNSWVYKHREVAASLLGRELIPGEEVHHIDEDKRNNNSENLMVFKSREDHIRFHVLSAAAKEVLLQEDGSYICRAKPSRVCLECDKSFIPVSNRRERPRKFCSSVCASRNKSIVKETSRIKLELHRKVWDKPIIEVAVDFGVSDVAIKKQCVKYSIPRPGVGFWNKIKAGKFENQVCPFPE